MADGIAHADWFGLKHFSVPRSGRWLLLIVPSEKKRNERFYCLLSSFPSAMSQNWGRGVSPVVIRDRPPGKKAMPVSPDSGPRMRFISSRAGNENTAISPPYSHANRLPSDEQDTNGQDSGRTLEGTILLEPFLTAQIRQLPSELPEISVSLSMKHKEPTTPVCPLSRAIPFWPSHRKV